MPVLSCGPGDIGASSHADDDLVSFALGSCVAVLVRAPGCVAAMAHVVVPSAAPPDGVPQKLGYYAPVAVPAVLRAFERLGGRVSGAQVLLVGGANVVSGMTSFDIGHRNVLATRKALWLAGVVPFAEDVEGTHSRTVRLSVGTGQVSISNPTQGRWFL